MQELSIDKLNYPAVVLKDGRIAAVNSLGRKLLNTRKGTGALTVFEPELCLIIDECAECGECKIVPVLPTKGEGSKPALILPDESGVYLIFLPEYFHRNDVEPKIMAELFADLRTVYAHRGAFNSRLRECISGVYSDELRFLGREKNFIELGEVCLFVLRRIKDSGTAFYRISIRSDKKRAYAKAKLSDLVCAILCLVDMSVTLSEAGNVNVECSYRQGYWYLDFCFSEKNTESFDGIDYRLEELLIDRIVSDNGFSFKRSVSEEGRVSLTFGIPAELSDVSLSSVEKKLAHIILDFYLKDL